MDSALFVLYLLCVNKYIELIKHEMKPTWCYGPLGAPLFSKLSFGYQKSRGRSHALLLMNMGFVFRKRVWKKYSGTPTHQTNNTNLHSIFIQIFNFVKSLEL